MRLAEIAAALDERSPTESDGTPDPEITQIVHDSRQAGSGALFCCLPGLLADGHDHAPDAVRAGAAALLCERPLDLAVPEVVVPNARRAMGLAAARFYREPSRDLTVVGVTGTNGKTTTVHLLEAVLSSAGRVTGVVGTLTGVRTTPEAPELQARLADWRDEGRDVVAMEVSSHALALHRVDGTWFAIAVFTNLSQDHLDFHGTMDDYYAAKARLFDPERAGVALVNVDDPAGRRLADSVAIEVHPYGADDATEVEVGLDRLGFTWRGERVEMSIGGRFNVANALAAAEVGVLLGLSPDAVARGLAGATPVPGRYESIDAGQGFAVLVDYAHTPDGLRQLLGAAREQAGAGRILVVFGCGGDRDRDKRAAMGEVGAAAADVVVITSDNPRSEEPGAIIDDVLVGVPDRDQVHVEIDRRAAIGHALAAAAPGDVVVIAGKGHETTQTTGDEVVPFDDREVARIALVDLLESPA